MYEKLVMRFIIERHMMLLLNSSVGFWHFLIVEGALGDEQVSDVVPVACQAAAQAGVPSVCVSNFRYVFIVLAPPGDNIEVFVRGAMKQSPFSWDVDEYSWTIPTILSL